MNDYLVQYPLKNDVLSDLQKEIKGKISIMSRNKKDIDLKISNLIDRISKSSNQTLISRYESSIESETAKQKELQLNIDEAEKKVSTIDTLKKKDFFDILSADDLFPTIEDGKRFIRLFIRRIEVNEKTGDIDILFNN